MMFGVEILRDWLLLSFRKVHKKEYILLWLTFLAIMIGEMLATYLLATASTIDACYDLPVRFPQLLCTSGMGRTCVAAEHLVRKKT